MILIVVSTAPNRDCWLQDCLASIDRPVMVVKTTEWELGSIRWVHQNLSPERFLFLQDSVVIHDQGIFNLIERVGGSSLLMPIPNCYMGVYCRSVLKQLPLPEIPAGTDSQRKEFSIKYEARFTREYCRVAKNCPVIFPELIDNLCPRREHRHGRINMVMENRWITKYKGTFR